MTVRYIILLCLLELYAERYLAPSETSVMFLLLQYELKKIKIKILYVAIAFTHTYIAFARLNALKTCFSWFHQMCHRNLLQ